MAACRLAIQKQRLDETSMQVNSVSGLIDIKQSRFTWKIVNINKLKKNDKYRNKSDDLEWTFTITKKSSLYAVDISGGSYQGDITCSILYDDDRASSLILADRITKGLYKVNFPLNIINIRENSFLNNNSIVLNFNLNNIWEIIRISLKPEAELPPLLHDYSTMYLKIFPTVKLNVDFVIHVENDSFDTHKAILAVRSSYFRQYIKENCKDGEVGEIKLDASHYAMFYVLFFMYTGHMVCDSKQLFIEILELSQRLGMSGIQKLQNRYMPLQ